MVAQIQKIAVKFDEKPVLSNLPTQGIMQIFTATDRHFYVDVIAQALRLGGQGTSVLIAQFFKGGINQGIHATRKLGQNLEWIRCDINRNIDFNTDLTNIEIKAILELWNHVKSLIFQGNYQLIILDELNLLIERSLVTESEIIDTLKFRPHKLDVTLTGANMPDSLLNIADQVTQRRR